MSAESVPDPFTPVDHDERRGFVLLHLRTGMPNRLQAALQQIAITQSRLCFMKRKLKRKIVNAPGFELLADI